MTRRNVADPLEVTDADRDVENSHQLGDPRCMGVDEQAVVIGRVVKDQDWLALSDGQWESDIVSGGELDPFRWRRWLCQYSYRQRCQNRQRK